MATGTRSKTSVYLLGTVDENISGKMLHTGKQVLRYFLHLHFDLKKPVKEAVSATVSAVSEFWERSRVPTQKEQRARDKVLKLFKKWCALKKKLETANRDPREKRGRVPSSPRPPFRHRPRAGDVDYNDRGGQTFLGRTKG